MEETNRFTVKTIKKSTSTSTEPREPKFELKRTGDDLVDHQGVEWIYLHCPHCNSYARFISEYTIIVKLPLNDNNISSRGFHSLIVCENCNDVIYLKCFEDDFDPDWWFGYEYHYPQATFALTETELPTLVYRYFLEAHKCLQANAYLAAVEMCKKTLDASLHDRNANKKLNPVESTKKPTDEKILPSVMSITDIVQIIESIRVHADEDDNIKKSQAEEVYKLTEKSLEAIYIIPIRVQQMKDKRSQIVRKDSSETSKD